MMMAMLSPYCAAAQQPYETPASARVQENFDGGWAFHKGDIAIDHAVKSGCYGGLTNTNVKVAVGEEAVIAYTDKQRMDSTKKSDWRSVTLPHDWCIESDYLYDPSWVKNGAPSDLMFHGFLPTGISFYRKEFTIPESDKGKKVSIEFEGIFRNSTVWVNGHLMGHHESGYTPSNYDLTDVLRYGNEGKNVVLVKVDASDYEGWWYEGAGIYRHVWLVKTDRLHVARFGTYVTTPTVTENEATVNVQTTLQNESTQPRTVQLTSRLTDEKGNVIATLKTDKTVGAMDEMVIDQSGTIAHPKLWSPETPNLYKVLTEVVENGKVVDNYETTFGVRTFRLDTTGFYLNGKHYPIKGTCNHQDFAGVGIGVPDKINEYKIRLLKEMGSNGYRCSHNPPTPALLDACDQLGMLVLDENRLLSSTEEGLKDLKTLICRDRNHPSVFMWSLENEESIQGSVIGARIIKTLADVAHKLDPSREVTAAMNHGWNSAGYSDALDVVGYNYGQRDLQYVTDHKAHPDRRMLVTESTSFTSTRGVYVDDNEKGFVSNYGTHVPGWSMPPAKDWEHIVKYPFLSGMFAWTGFDYRGEPTPISNWPCVTSHFGIMDYCGFPKDGYYAYKAAWRDEPLVHIFPHWNWKGQEGDSIKVQGYTNCDEVELFVNGKSIGRQKAVPFNKLQWVAIYKPGKLLAKGYKNGKLVATDLVETAGEPAQIGLQSDVKTLAANGMDVVVVNVAIKDSKGRVVPTADNLVKFFVEGPAQIFGTGNGNPSSHEPDKAAQRMAFNGYCMLLVQSSKNPGIIKIKAVSDKLKSAEITIQSKMGERK